MGNNDDEVKSKITAIINDKVVDVTHVCSYRDAYKDIKGIEYLGTGYYHTIDGRRSSDTSLNHFWILKPIKKNYQTGIPIDLDSNVLDLRLIKIKSCSLPTYWYHDKIGKRYFVGETTSFGEVCYCVYVLLRDLESLEKDIVNNFYKSGYIIQKEDCEIIME